MKAFQIVISLIAVVALGLAGFGIAKAYSLNSQLDDSKSQVATLTQQVTSLNQSMQLIEPVLTASPLSTIGPNTISTGDYFDFGFDVVHPMDRVAITFQASSRVSYMVSCGAESDVVASALPGETVESPCTVTFIAPAEGGYSLQFQNPLDTTPLPTITFTVTVYPAAPVVSDPQSIGK